MDLTGIKDIDFKILNKLDDGTLVTYCTANKGAMEVCNDQIFWMNRILKTFPYLDVDSLREYKGNRSWSELYINDLRKLKLADEHTQNDFAVKWGNIKNRSEISKYMADNTGIF